MGRILRRLKQLSVRSLNRGDYSVEGKQPGENTDALTATGGRGLDPQGGTGHQGAPVGWVKPDDGRPQH